MASGLQCFVVLNKDCSIFSLSIKKHCFSYIHISHACWEQRDFIMNFILYQGTPRGWYLVVTVRSCTPDGAHSVGGTHAEGSGTTPPGLLHPTLLLPRLPASPPVDRPLSSPLRDHHGLFVSCSFSNLSPTSVGSTSKRCANPTSTCRAPASLTCLPD